MKYFKASFIKSQPLRIWKSYSFVSDYGKEDFDYALSQILQNVDASLVANHLSTLKIKTDAGKTPSDDKEVGFSHQSYIRVLFIPKTIFLLRCTINVYDNKP